MKVVMVSKALVVGSYQRKLEAMAAHPDLSLVAVVPPVWRGEGIEQRLEAVPTRGYRLSVQPIRFNGNFHLFHWPTLPRLFRELKPDLVHVDEEPYNLATFMAIRAAQGVGASTVFFSWQNLQREYPPPFRWLEQWVYRQADAAIAGTAEVAEVLRRKGHRGRVAVIPQFGVDADRFSPPASPPGSPPWVIGFVGRLVEVKGLSVLLEAVTRLQRPWRLELIGTGPLRQKLAVRASELEISDRVIFRDQVPSSHIPELMRSLHVLVLPSLTRPHWKEQFGRALVEAMACGVPVVGSDSGEIPRVIGDGGLVTPEGDRAALASTLDRLLGDSSLRQELGKRGRARVLEHYTHERIADQTVALYREILAA